MSMNMNMNLGNFGPYGAPPPIGGFYPPPPNYDFYGNYPLHPLPPPPPPGYGYSGPVFFFAFFCFFHLLTHILEATNVIFVTKQKIILYNFLIFSLIKTNFKAKLDYRLIN
jgi:hypothetical protein